MKIAMIYDMIFPFNVGGGEARNYFLAKELIARGHEVHFFGAKLWKGKNTIVKDGIIMHGVYQSKYLYKKGKRSIFEPIKFSLKLIRPLFKEKFDIIDCTAFPFFPAFVCKFYSWKKKVPLLLTWHEVWDEYWTYYLGFKGHLAKLIERLVSKLTKNHLAVSERTKKRLLKINKKADVKVVPNFIDVDKIDRVRVSKEKYDLAFFGRLLAHKNVDLLLKATRILVHQFPNMKVLIVGKGPEKNNLLRLTKKLGVEDNVVFKDFLSNHDEVYALMKSSKIFVFPSILEGFGIVVIEAMACGLPIIGVSHKWNASEDLIKENKAGYVVEGKANQIAEKIKYLLKNSRSYNSLVGNNYSKSKNYDINIVVKQIEKVYEELKC